VALADGVTYRLFRERLSGGTGSVAAGLPSGSPKGSRVSPKPRSREGGWFVEGIVD
jgi:hypothetical protein